MSLSSLPSLPRQQCPLPSILAQTLNTLRSTDSPDYEGDGQNHIFADDSLHKNPQEVIIVGTLGDVNEVV